MATSKNLREVQLAAQQISLAKVLAANDKAVRDKGVKRLGKWITARSSSSLDFTQQDLMTIWKGLFYCMWMADKPLYQEELAERISRLIHCFKKLDKGLLYAECFFVTMRREWFGIDQYRLDKFMMLVRRCIRQMFTYCSSFLWSAEACAGISQLLESGVTSSAESTPTMGLLLHVADVILEELAKVESGEKGLQAVLRPFASLIANSTDARIRQHISERIFHHLIRQSPLGIEFQEKFEAWKQAGFPGNSWRDMELVELSDEEEPSDNEGREEITDPGDAEKHLDPRAGKVDVELPSLEFDATEVAALLKAELQKASNLKQRKALNMLATQFLELANGKYPLGFKKPEGSTERRNRVRRQKELWKAAEELIEFEEELLDENNDVEESAVLKSGRKRKRQNDIGKVVQDKRRKTEISSPVQIGKFNGSTDDDHSSTTTPKKSPKNIQNHNKNNKNPLGLLKKKSSKQEIQKNMPAKLHNSVLEPQNRNTLILHQENATQKNSNQQDEASSSEKITKRKMKSKIKSKVKSVGQSPVIQNSMLPVVNKSVGNKKFKQKEESKSLGVLQNDENRLLQSSAELVNVTPNGIESSKLQLDITGSQEQKILHEYSSRRNSEPPRKKKPNDYMPQKFYKSDAKQNFHNDVPVSLRKMTLRRSLTLEQHTSRATPKKRNSLSSWEVTDIPINSVSTKATKSEGVDSSSTITSVLSQKPSETVSSLVKTPKPNTCSTTEITENMPEALNRPAENPRSAKKVNIVLNRNIAFEARDYPKAVKQSPNIPFDADKKPVQGVLKAGLLPSPVNPFYRKSKRLKL